MSEPTVPLKLVLDTQVVLDWLLFNDTAVESLRHAIDTQHVMVLTHDFARDELSRVLAYPQFALDTPQQHAVMDAYRRDTLRAPADVSFSRDNLLLPPHFPRCRDADDQPFLALCFHAHADALITRDKALLAVRKRCLQFGVRIVGYREMPALF